LLQESLFVFVNPDSHNSCP